MLPLTYLAQVRQISLNTQFLQVLNARLKRIHASITRRFLPIELRGNCGRYVRAIVTIGTVRAADLAGQNRNMVAWLRGAKC